MKLEGFQTQLAQGRGGVALFIQQNLPLPAEYREALLHACLNDLRFDYQIEEGRGHYLYTLILLTGETDFYRTPLLMATAGPTPENVYDLLQWMNTVRKFAERGDAEAKVALYEVFERNATQDNLYGGDELVLLDGLDGLLYLVDRHDDEENGYEISEFDWQLYLLDKREGEETVWHELKAKCAGNPAREDWLRRLRAYREERKQPTEAKSLRPTYEELKQLIAEEGREVGTGRSWAKRMTKQDREQAASDLSSSTDPEWIIPLLRVFTEVPFPRDPARLFEWTKNEDSDLSWAALQALCNLKSPDVRAFALEAVQKARSAGAAIKMLNTNYHEGDAKLVIAALKLPAQPDHLHNICRGARSFEKTHPSEFSPHILKLCYERTPCSSCREWITERLIEVKALPEGIRREAVYDAEEGTRKLVAENGTQGN